MGEEGLRSIGVVNCTGGVGSMMMMMMVGSEIKRKRKCAKRKARKESEMPACDGREGGSC